MSTTEDELLKRGLSQIAAQHGTDKLKHGYIPHYERYFEGLRSRGVTLLEIGVGGYMDPTAGGASLRMWRDYFHAARIVGLDRFAKSLELGDRVTVVQGSQTDRELLHELARRHGPFDIVIDDGSHVNSDRTSTFRHLFPLLSPEGIYVIEDLHTSYWRRTFGGEFRDLSTTTTTVGFLKALVDGLQHDYIPAWTPAPFDRLISGISFHSKIAFVFKGVNDHALNMIEAGQVQQELDAERADNGETQRR